LQEMPVALLGHPFCAGEMAVESPPGTDRLADRINVQNDPRYRLPMSTFGIRVEQTQIGDEAFVIVRCQHPIRWRGISDIRTDW